MSVTFAVMVILLNLTSIVLGDITTASRKLTSNPLTEIKTNNIILVVVVVLLFFASIVGVYYVTHSAFSFIKSLRKNKNDRITTRYGHTQKTCCQYVPMVQSDDSDVVLYEADPLLP
ncbi:hypothetical protein PPYR_05306 [Photinus pyralis]|uniref:Uncharacterized protein n=1 Tax=Photinus pyralis TaxID=7054 RepID=A0A5N4AUA2_PHOPY|nr:uncharacterized protein LOC116165309 [Photinus pyralis]KAB0800952.1 hypothetical protein PPYR_05306 [Photinus pyralis]